MAHKKAAGKSKNGRDSNPKFLGLKKAGGEQVTAGMIIIRQRGTSFCAGKNVYVSRDHTIHAKVDGKVCFSKFKKANVVRTRVFVEAAAQAA